LHSRTAELKFKAEVPGCDSAGGREGIAMGLGQQLTAFRAEFA